METKSSIVDGVEFESLIEEEYLRAAYTEEENPNNSSVYFVYIDAELDGERVFIKTMSPTTLPEDEEAEDSLEEDSIEQTPYVVAIETAISFFLGQFEPSNTTILNGNELADTEKSLIQ